MGGKSDLFLLEGPCLQTVSVSSPLSRTAEELITFCHGKPRGAVFLVFLGHPGHEDRLHPGCAWVFLSESHILAEIFTMAEIMGY